MVRVPVQADRIGYAGQLKPIVAAIHPDVDGGIRLNAKVLDRSGGGPIGFPAQQRRVALLSSLRHRLEANAICAVEGLDGLSAPKTRAVAKAQGGT